jgi:uncharacterized protein
MAKNDGIFARTALTEFRGFIDQRDFPCLGAKAAFNAQSYLLRGYNKLGSDLASDALADDLRAFIQSTMRTRSEYASFIAVFRHPLGQTEAEFEEQLWSQLRKLNQIDAACGYFWDRSVASHPDDPHFSFSFAGQALYVVGMHANSSRAARRFRWPTLVFNPHEQFERLRAGGKWQRMQETIRTRDRRFGGSVNPMLSDFGEKSEARQYSGRVVEENWQPPFAALNPKASARCPFAH